VTETRWTKSQSKSGIPSSTIVEGEVVTGDINCLMAEASDINCLMVEASGLGHNRGTWAAVTLLSEKSCALIKEYSF